jgi:uncharacterized Zn-binding protein involved in type VI secretion
MPKAARKGDRARHGKSELIAVQGSPDVSINGLPAVRRGDIYQKEAHPASGGSATVNINGKPAVRIGDSVAGHAIASTGSNNVFIGDNSYGAAKAGQRPVYEILLSQVPGSADPAYVYANYPYKLYHNGGLVQQGNSDALGLIAYEYEPPLKGTLRVELGNGDSVDMELASFASADTRQGIVQRMRALGYLHYQPDESNTDIALREANSEQGDLSVDGVLQALAASIKSKMP